MKKALIQWWLSRGLGVLTPTVQSSNIIISGITSTTLTFNWTNGNGSSRLVLMKAGSTVNTEPLDGVSYTANSVFGMGSLIDTGTYVVRIGSGPVTVTGLTQDTTYHIAVYEFNGTSGTEAYLQSPATANQKTFTTQYQSILTHAASQSIDLDDLDVQIVIDSYIKDLVDNNVITLADQITLGYGFPNDRRTTLINIKNPGTRNWTLASDTNFNRPFGWGRFGSASNRIRSNFIPATHGVNYTQNDCGIVFYIPTDRPQSNTEETFGCGQAATANGIDCLLRSTGNALIFRLNHAASITVAGNTNTTGLYHLQRTGATSVRALKNGVQMAAPSVVPSTGLCTQEIDIGSFNNNGTHSNPTSAYLSLWIIGASFTGLESILNSAWATFKAKMDALVTAPSMPSFPTYTSVSDDLADYLTSIGGLKTAVPNTKLVWEYQTSVGSLRLQGSALDASKLKIVLTPSTSTTSPEITHSTNPYNTTVANVGTLTATVNKYGGQARSGNLIGWCPFAATAVGIKDTTSGVITYYDTTGVVANADAGNLTGSEKWWGWYIGANGRWWGIPYKATEVIEFDPITKAFRFFDTTGEVAFGAGNLGTAGKWDSGSIGGIYLYGSVSGATQMIRINTSTGAVTLHGSFPAGTTKWSISAVDQVNGVTGMLMCGYSRTDAIFVNLADFSYVTLTGSFAVGATGSVGCMALMPNGKYMAMPLGSTSIYEIDLQALTITTIGTFPASQTFNSKTLTPSGAVWFTHLTTGTVVTGSVNKRSFALPDNHVFSRYITSF